VPKPPTDPSPGPPGEGDALARLLALAESLGTGEPGLVAYEPEPGGQAYTAFVSWLVQGGSCAELAFLANLAAYGENCRRLAGMLKGRCDTSFFEFFATNSCSPRQALTRSRCARRRL